MHVTNGIVYIINWNNGILLTLLQNIRITLAVVCFFPAIWTPFRWMTCARTGGAIL